MRPPTATTVTAVSQQKGRGVFRGRWGFGALWNPGLLEPDDGEEAVAGEEELGPGAGGNPPKGASGRHGTTGFVEPAGEVFGGTPGAGREAIDEMSRDPDRIARTGNFDRDEGSFFDEVDDVLFGDGEHGGAFGDPQHHAVGEEEVAQLPGMPGDGDGGGRGRFRSG